MPEAQAKKSWTPPSGTLGTIVAEAIVRAEALRLVEGDWQEQAMLAPARPSLRDALSGGTVALISEVKRRSPSLGVINPDLDAVAQAQAYVSGGASAVSVLTEPVHFGGAPEDLSQIASVVDAPLLKKDFHVDPVQLYQARALGASAVLLIVRALHPETLLGMMEIAEDIGLEAVVEVRDDEELAIALDAGATIIGVNNRNLETLIIDDTTVQRLIPQVPQGCVAIAESGMRTPEDVRKAATYGADAVLIGSAVSAATDPTQAVAALAGVSVNRNGRPA